MKETGCKGHPRTKKTKTGSLPDAATLGDLARALHGSCATASPRVYLVLPGSDRPVSPLAVQTPLRNFMV